MMKIFKRCANRLDKERWPMKEEEEVIESCRETKKEESVSEEKGRLSVPSDGQDKNTLHDVVDILIGMCMEKNLIQREGNPKGIDGK